MTVNAQTSSCILVLESASDGINTPQDSEQIHDLGGPWERIELPEGEIDTGTSESSYEVHHIPASLPEPKEREKDVYGIIAATEKAHCRWFRTATETICRGDDPTAAQSYRDWASENKLLPKLERQVLIHDIETSSVKVQEKLSQNIVLLLLHLNDQRSENTQIYLKSDREGLIARFVHSLRIHAPPRRPKDDELQTTSLVRALLELSGGRVDRQQHKFSEGSTTYKNAELFASVFEIQIPQGFKNADVHEMMALTSESPLFSQSRISIQDFDDRAKQIRNSLLVGSREEHMILPSRVLARFSVGQVEDFRCYLSQTYTSIKSLSRPQNNQLVLLVWATTLSHRQTNVANRTLDILEEWATSEEGDSLYNDLIQSARYSQTMEQLVLTTVAMLGYSCLVPDNLDHIAQPFKGSYLADLDTHLRGHALGSRTKVAEHMVLAMIRVLSTHENRWEELVAFLGAAIYDKPPLLHTLAGLSDQYLNLRIRNVDHETAFRSVMTEASYLIHQSNVNVLVRTLIPILSPEGLSHSI